MKKRLLITSIVMMLVVAVALSTATYAWFTSNVSVTANSVTMTAGTSQSTALGIEWSAGTSGPGFNAHYTTNINSVAPADTTTQAGGFQPAAPVLLDTVSTHTAPEFTTAFVNAQGLFKTAGTTTDVYRFANYKDSATASAASATLSDLIHVANLAQSGAQTLYLTASIKPIYELVPADTARGSAVWYTDNDGTDTVAGNEITNSGSGTYYVKNDGTALIRIAVYEYANSQYTYKGLLGAAAGSNNTAQGAIGATNAASALLTASTTTELNLGTINAQTDKAYAIYVWLDGALFDEAQSGKSAMVGLTFSTTKVSDGAVAEING